MNLYLNSTLVFEGELDKGCGNQIFDYSTSIDLQALQVPESFSPSPVGSGHSLRGASPQRHDESGMWVESRGENRDPNHGLSEGLAQVRIDMQDKIYNPPSPTSTNCPPLQRDSFDMDPPDLALPHPPLKQQLEQSGQPTVTTQPSSSRSPQWLQPLARSAPEGCEAGRERPLWLVPQQSVEPKPPLPQSTSTSVLPELGCNPGRVCRGVERTVNEGQWSADSLDLGGELLEELSDQQRQNQPVSGRRSSARHNNTTSTSSKPAVEHQHGAIGLSTGS